MAETSLVFNILARDKASSTFDKLKGKAALLGAAIGVMAVKFAKDSVTGFVEAEAAQTRLSAAFDKFPALADTNIGRLRTLNIALAQKTKYDDDSIASGQAVLAQFGLTGRELERVTPLLTDYAAKTGQDITSAATGMGRALLGNTRALKTIGIGYKMTGDATRDYANITQLMRDKVGGFAEKEGKTAAGQAQILRNQFGELQEQAGSKLVPALMQVAEVLLTVIAFTQKYGHIIVPVVAVLGTAATAIWAVNAAAKAYTAVQAALNVVLTANPIGLVIAAIAALVIGLVIAYNKSETFREIVNGAFRDVATAGRAMWEVLQDAFRFITNAWMNVAGAIIDGAVKAFGWIPGIGDKLRGAQAQFHAFKDSVNAALGQVQDRNVTITARVVQIGQGTLANKRIPLFAGGVRDFGGGLALVGERGPEIVYLPPHSDVYSNSESRQMMASPNALTGSASVTNTFNIYDATDPQKVVAAIQEYERRNSARWRS